MVGSEPEVAYRLTAEVQGEKLARFFSPGTGSTEVFGLAGCRCRDQLRASAEVTGTFDCGRTFSASRFHSENGRGDIREMILWNGKISARSTGFVAVALFLVVFVRDVSCEPSSLQNEYGGVPWSLLGRNTVVPQPIRSGWVESLLVGYENIALKEVCGKERGSSSDIIRLELYKSQFLLLVWVRDRVVKAYRISLSGSPVGDKMFQGDKKTPEGRYMILKHHSPTYGLSFYVCYPNRADGLRAYLSDEISYTQFKRIEIALEQNDPPPKGTALGSQILVHTQRVNRDTCATCNNWSIGCIVMESEDLDELLMESVWGEPLELTIMPVDFDLERSLFEHSRVVSTIEERH